MIIVRRELVAIVVSLLLGAAACSADVTGADALALQAEALSSSCAPAVPDALKVPEGNKLDFVADAEGVQIYVCQAAADGSAAWTLKAPDAQLFGKRGRLIGIHYAGPTWEGLDGSTVVGARVAAAPSPDPSAIPWLLLSAASNTGHGLMSKVTFIQRLDTVGGLAPQTGCDADHLGATVESEYSAAYYFYKATRGRH